MFYCNNNKSSEVTADLSSPGCGNKSTFSLRRAPLRLPTTCWLNLRRPVWPLHDLNHFFRSKNIKHNDCTALFVKDSQWREDTTSCQVVRYHVCGEEDVMDGMFWLCWISSGSEHARSCFSSCVQFVGQGEPSLTQRRLAGCDGCLWWSALCHKS